ncbi:MAG: hypothetical protein CL401_08795 [Acidiferrobacteraceae bacterium]|nr:hypothetical protein [Acidiferrobacteraceae bacterium]
MDIVADIYLFGLFIGFVFLIASFPYLLLIQLGWIAWLCSPKKKSLDVTNDALSNHMYLISVGWLPAICSSVFILNGWQVDSGEEYFRLLKGSETLEFNRLLFSIVTVLLFLVYLLFRKLSSRIKSASGRVRLRITLAVGLMPFAFSLFSNLRSISFWLKQPCMIGRVCA